MDRLERTVLVNRHACHGGTPDVMGTRDVSGRLLLSTAAGAKSREEPGQERPRVASNMEYGEHGRNEPSGRTRDESKWPTRSARRDAKSKLAQIRSHDGIKHSDRAACVNASPCGAPNNQ